MSAQHDVLAAYFDEPKHAIVNRQPLRPNPFPTHVFPAWLSEFVTTTASCLEVPEGMVGALALGALSYAAAGRFEVNVHGEWAEPPVLYLMISANPAERKSPTLKRVIAPLYAFILDESKRVAKGVSDIAAERELLEESIKILKNVIVKDKGTDAAALESKKKALASKRSELEAMTLPPGPPLLLDDVTPEAMARCLVRSSGVGAIISAEGSAFANQSKGQYSSGNSNLGLLCKAYDGEPYRVDRVGREPITLPRALMTVCVTVQPSVLRSIATDDIRGQGLFARFMFACPPSRVGQRPCLSKQIPGPIKQNYAYRLGSILTNPIPPAPRAVWFSKDAAEHLEAYRKFFEPRLAGDLQAMADFGGKHVGKVVRLAGLLHMADTAGELLPNDEDAIAKHTIERAIALGDYFLNEAINVYGDISAGKPAVELDQFATQLKAKYGAEPFAVRDVLTNRWARGSKAPVIADKLALLVDDGSILEMPPTPPRTTPTYRFA
jgi:replicative DNA helicase